MVYVSHDFILVTKISGNWCVVPDTLTLEELSVGAGRPPPCSRLCRPLAVGDFAEDVGRNRGRRGKGWALAPSGSPQPSLTWISDLD